ncbi:MAG: heme exporter protein CcmD [Sphingomicrobium sp.]
MNHWPFIIAAYGIVLGASVALTAWSWRSMRAAERFADEVTKR